MNPAAIANLDEDIDLAELVSDLGIGPLDELEARLASSPPFDIQVSAAEDNVAMWVPGIPTHGEGATFTAAQEDLLDALIEYAETWARVLRFAPNHTGHRDQVLQLLLADDDRDRLRRVVFDG